MTDKFKKIQTIDLDNAKSWENKFFLTIDIDWACDGVLSDTIDLIEVFLQDRERTTQPRNWPPAIGLRNHFQIIL